MDKNTQLYYNSALDLSLPVQEVAELDGFRLSLGNNYYYFYGYAIPFNYGIGASLSTNKYLANNLLSSAGVPVPKAGVISRDSFNRQQLACETQHLKFPLVLKPSNGSFGRDVICNIPNFDRLYKDAELLFKNNDLLCIEEFHGNMQSYRVLIFNNKILAVTKRYPAQITGDGVRTISELVKIQNKKRAKINCYMRPIRFDNETMYRLNTLNLTPSSIINKGIKITLNYTSNARRGGSFENISTRMCKENITLMQKIVSTLNLKMAGIDIECNGFDKPIVDNGGVIIEVNPYPSMRMHEDTHKNNRASVTKKILRSLIARHPISYIKHICQNTNLAFYLIQAAIISTFIYYLS